MQIRHGLGMHDAEPSLDICGVGPCQGNPNELLPQKGLWRRGWHTPGWHCSDTSAIGQLVRHGGVSKLTATDPPSHLESYEPILKLSCACTGAEFCSQQWHGCTKHLWLNGMAGCKLVCMNSHPVCQERASSTARLNLHPTLPTLASGVWLL